MITLSFSMQTYIRYADHPAGLVLDLATGAMAHVPADAKGKDLHVAVEPYPSKLWTSLEIHRVAQR